METVRGLRLVTAEVDAILLARAGHGPLRAYLVDARYAGWLDLAALERRLAIVGPVPGRRLLRSEIDTLLDREPESVFHDRVLDELLAAGYGPEPRPVEIRTPLGRDLWPDIALPRWQVAVELDGDRFHRDREQRRRDRDRLAAYASTSWRPVVVDWHSWHEDRPGVLAAIDAAIDVQRRLGIGRTIVCPVPPTPGDRVAHPGRVRLVGGVAASGRGRGQQPTAVTPVVPGATHCAVGGYLRWEPLSA